MTTENKAITETRRRERGHAFYPPPDVLAAIPALCGTESQAAADKILHLHYFVGGCDWWIAELDPAEGLAFGYACLADAAMAEWGYVSLPELEGVFREGQVLSDGGEGAMSIVPRLIVERDLAWTPTRAGDAGLPGRCC